MANDAIVKQLQAACDKVLSFDRDKLVKRSEWGTISFERGERDFRRIFDIANWLKAMPCEVLTDAIVQSITQALENCRSHIEQIDHFTIESGNPAGNRDSLLSNLAASADQLFMQASPWIPFLAYQKGDVSRNINELNGAVKSAAGLISAAKAEIERKSGEIDEIIVRAREASAAAGAAVFTEDFARQAKSLEDSARKWLIGTIILAVGTLASAVVFFCLIHGAAGQLEVFQRVTAKLAILGILITATLWSGRIYKALMHQASVYRFKSLGLQTFRAFSAGASDTTTKDAVLLETTRAIFSVQNSGYIESGSGNESETRIVELVKGSLPQSGG
ncbi:MAG: hypothetical protein ACK45B_06405 [Limisphaerales bacterium]|jgi:hypothetical protein